jgi:hypothetical protein
MTTALWQGTPGDVIRLLAQRPLPLMADAITSLRAHGHHALADELHALREQWARTAMAHAEPKLAVAGVKR